MYFTKCSYDKLKLKIKYEPISTTLVAASGENLKVYGKVKLPFKIDGVSFEHDFVVVEHVRNIRHRLVKYI